MYAEGFIFSIYRCPSKHNTICALTLETVVSFDKNANELGCFHQGAPPPPPPSLTDTEGPHSWGLNALQAACVGVVLVAVGLAEDAEDTVDVPKRCKRGEKLIVFCNSLWLSESATLYTVGHDL